MVPDNLLDINAALIIFISIPFITMIVVTLVYIVDYYRETLRQVVTELWKRVRK